MGGVGTGGGSAACRLWVSIVFVRLQQSRKPVPARPRMNPMTAACRLTAAGRYHPGPTARPRMFPHEGSAAAPGLGWHAGLQPPEARRLTPAAVARRWPRARGSAVDLGWIKTRLGGPGAADEVPEGAETQVWLAISDEPAAAVTDHYLRHRRDVRANPAAHDVALQDALLAARAALTGRATALQLGSRPVTRLVRPGAWACT